MNLYKVYNGYTGFSAVHVIVLADNNNRAVELASEAFKKEGEGKYKKSYWSNLEAELLAENIKEYVSEVTE